MRKSFLNADEYSVATPLEMTEDRVQKMLLRREIFGKVLDGTKTSTSRKGIREVFEGPLVFEMTEDKDTTVTVIVTGVTYVHYRDLSDEEAKLEGYNNVDELKTALTKIYGDISPEEPFTFVTFCKAKQLNISMAYTYVGDTELLVPESFTLEQAEQYAQTHIDDIPVATNAEYIPNSDYFEIDDCSFN